MKHLLVGWLVYLLVVPVVSAETTGLLLLAHGAHRHDTATGKTVNVWNRNVEAVGKALNEKIPTAVAFGMADPLTIQKAIDELEGRGVDAILAVPVFVSSHSPIIGNFRYILRFQPELAKTTQLKHLDRAHANVAVHFGNAMDDHPLISEILLARAQEVSAEPARTTVILIAHGPNDEEENRRWLQDLSAHAAFIKHQGGFRDVRYITHRNDALPEVKDKARAELRSVVASASKDGAAVVVPVLLSAGGIEHQIKADLHDLDFRLAQPLLPHSNVQAWIEAQYHAFTSELASK